MAKNNHVNSPRSLGRMLSSLQQTSLAVIGTSLAVLALGLPAQPSRAVSPRRAPVPIGAGESLYLRGVLSTGEPLRGERASAPGGEGADAACVNCHRRSGLGQLEGLAPVPAITAWYLYRPRSEVRPRHEDAGELPAAAPEPGAQPELLLRPRSAYTDATLARAIRDGVGADGQPLSFLMPRFRIDDADMASLIAYLKQLSQRPSPGAGETTLELATIITPDADPVKRRGMLDVLTHFFGAGNVFMAGKGPPPQYSHGFFPLIHHLQLNVWELSGAPESWQAQLDERLREEPVFAVVSGLGGKTWEPVHRFCQRSGVPCLFPNVDLPVVAGEDFYDIYFSKGVLLEAELIAARLRAGAAGPAGPRRLVQVYRRGDIGESAAAELRRVLAASATQAADHVLEPEADPPQVRGALEDVRPGDVLVLWLRPKDLGALPAQPP
ncbi:MAG: c-type cytochrome, partial [Steroidobacteraceae bacterium]